MKKATQKQVTYIYENLRGRMADYAVIKNLTISEASNVIEQIKAAYNDNRGNLSARWRELQRISQTLN